jgi:hypothetical protein
MARTGTADLPLHGGHVPRWLADRMTALGRVLTEAIVLEYGRDEWLRRVSHPFWFQSLGAVMGMDWHSSGITTSVLGALKRGLTPIADELGLFVAGGRGKLSLRTPAELVAIGERTGLDGAALARTSRLVAKVDSAAVQDGFSLYLHGFFVSKEGRWAVVQQGLDGESHTARRYHWLSEGLESFTTAPHAAIEGAPARGASIANLTDVRAESARRAQLELVRSGPDAVVREIARTRPASRAGVQPALPHLDLPAHHEVTSRDVALQRLHASIAAAAERGPVDFRDVLETPGVGARTVLALAMVAEIVHGAPYRFADPARFSLAHGGKDGHPFPVPLRVYDRTVRVMKDAVARAKLGERDRLSALRRLDDEARRVDRAARGGPSLDAFLAAERAASHARGGMTVAGPAAPVTTLGAGAVVEPEESRVS